LVECAGGCHLRLTRMRMPLDQSAFVDDAA
jgi:hypothetical protein